MYYGWDSTRPSSTTTRIKTLIQSSKCTTDGTVLDHRPLQQGLRLDLTFFIFYHVLVLDHRPLQQGLRQWNNKTNYQTHNNVLDHRPLQQGLRHELIVITVECTGSTRPSSTTTRIKTPLHVTTRMCHQDVLDHRPLQQGLRPIAAFLACLHLLPVRDHLPLQ